MDKTNRRRTEGEISWEERKEMVEKYLSGRSKSEVWQEHMGGRYDKGAILRWIRKLGYDTTNIPIRQRQKLPTLAVEMKKEKKQELPNDPETLKERIAALEKELLESKIRLRASELTIEYAEKELKLSLKKKPDTK